MKHAAFNNDVSDILKDVAQGTSFGKLRLKTFESVDSTMNAAKEQERDLPPEDRRYPGLYLSLEQTQGRGRKNRTWLSSMGSAIYATFAFHTPLAPDRVAAFSLALGVCVSRTLERFGVEAKLKWPNDVLVAEAGKMKKISGILVEMVSSSEDRRLICAGIGLNVYRQSWPSGVPGISLEELGRKETYNEVLQELCSHVLESADDYFQEGFSPFWEDWNRRNALLGESVYLPDTGTMDVYRAGEVDKNGALIVRRISDGLEQRVISGEIEWKDAFSN